MKKIIASQTTSGQESKDTKCRVRTQYAGGKPSSINVLFSQKKGAITEIENGFDGETVYRATQSKVLKQDGDDVVDLIESFSVSFQNADLVSLELSIAEVDHQNDPHETVFYCSNLDNRTHNKF